MAKNPDIPMVTPTFGQVYDELEEEHRDLMVLVEKARGLRSTVGLTSLLERLHTSLIKHFSHEQFPGGLYERMGAHGSRYHDELKILVEDHCIILSAACSSVRVLPTGMTNQHYSMIWRAY